MHRPLIRMADCIQLLQFCGSSLESYEVIQGFTDRDCDTRRWTPYEDQTQYDHRALVVDCPRLISISLDDLGPCALPFHNLHSLRTLTLQGKCLMQKALFTQRVCGDWHPNLERVHVRGPLYGVGTKSSGEVMHRKNILQEMEAAATSKGVRFDAEEVFEQLEAMKRSFLLEESARKALSSWDGYDGPWDSAEAFGDLRTEEDDV